MSEPGDEFFDHDGYPVGQNGDDDPGDCECDWCRIARLSQENARLRARLAELSGPSPAWGWMAAAAVMTLIMFALMGGWAGSHY